MNDGAVLSHGNEAAIAPDYIGENFFCSASARYSPRLAISAVDDRAAVAHRDEAAITPCYAPETFACRAGRRL